MSVYVFYVKLSPPGGAKAPLISEKKKWIRPSTLIFGRTTRFDMSNESSFQGGCNDGVRLVDKRIAGALFDG